MNTRIPVLLVHGFNSDETTWHPETQKYLAQSSDVCIATFDYHPFSTNWVTNPHIGHALAQYITQLADQSQEHHGPGKVIVIGHSLGGLATLCAATEDCNDAGVASNAVHDVASKILDLISFGTPYTGTYLKGGARSWLTDILGPWLSFAGGCYEAGRIPGLCDLIQAFGTSAAAHAFTPGSKELKALAKPSFPVLAVTGSMPVTTSLFGHTIATVTNAGDLVVTPPSALADSNRYTELGGSTILGGERTVDCGTIDLDGIGLLAAGTPIGAGVDGAMSSYKCWHGTEPNYQGFDQAALNEINRITAWLTKLATPTIQVNLAPVDSAGKTANGWTVAPDPHPTTIECATGGVDAAPSAVSGNIYDCAPSSAEADACWKGANYYSMLCLGDPWSHTVNELPTSDLPGPVTPRDRPIPIGLELADGDHCRLRVGGSWGFPKAHPNYTGAYSCQKHEAVWAPGSGIEIDTSSEQWSVIVGNETGPLVNLAVVKAYFVTSAGN